MSRIAQPCLGGRYREISDTEIIIQCECDFFCSSRKKIFIRNFKREKFPYYYIPERDQELKTLLNKKYTPTIVTRSKSKENYK